VARAALADGGGIPRGLIGRDPARTIDIDIIYIEDRIMSDTTRTAFGHDTTATEAIEGIDLTGKLALVTGGSSGIGVETARALASAGAEVVITARNMPKGEGVAADIRESTGNGAVSVAELELDSMESIRRFAEAFLAEHDALHVLVNTAGVMASPPMKTEDGIELQFGTNHVGHFLLTNLLMPALLRGAPSLIISLSSRGHHFSPVVFDDIQFQNRDYNKWAAYGQSKTANILFAVGLEDRFGGKGVHAYAVHPGGIMTELGRHLTEEDRERVRKRMDNPDFSWKTIPQGAATSVYAATAPELEGRGGVYLEDCHVSEINDDPEALDGVKSYALDTENADRLWEVSEEMVGEKFSRKGGLE
jgi:NAD(P)-dependent dehydrogenase (short-subunit alcohol dehydrogenase family)